MLYVFMSWARSSLHIAIHFDGDIYRSRWFISSAVLTLAQKLCTAGREVGDSCQIRHIFVLLDAAEISFCDMNVECFDNAT